MVGPLPQGIVQVFVPGHGFDPGHGGMFASGYMVLLPQGMVGCWPNRPLTPFYTGWISFSLLLGHHALSDFLGFVLCLLRRENAQELVYLFGPRTTFTCSSCLQLSPLLSSPPPPKPDLLLL